MSRHITVAVPAYAGTVHLLTLRSLLHDLVQLVGRGDKFTLIDDCGNGVIADSRAEICARFLEEETSSDLVMIDHDISWDAGSLLRLLDHDVDVVAGSYPFRRDPIVFPIRWIEERKEIWSDPKTGLIEVAGVPGGFLRISRKALLKMSSHYTNLEYECHKTEKPVVGLFEPYRIEKKKLSEDYSFCQRWRDLGGRVWVDPEITMAHIGNKSFNGNLGKWLRSDRNG